MMSPKLRQKLYSKTTLSDDMSVTIAVSLAVYMLKDCKEGPGSKSVITTRHAPLVKKLLNALNEEVIVDIEAVSKYVYGYLYILNTIKNAPPTFTVNGNGILDMLVPYYSKSIEELNDKIKNSHSLEELGFDLTQYFTSLCK